MAITVESVATATNDDESTIVVNKPTGTVDGDLLLAAISTRDGGAIDTPSGWTLIDSLLVTDVDAKWAWKIAASEPSSYTFTWDDDSGVYGAAAVARISGVDATSPVNAAGKNSPTPSLGLAPLPQVTTTVSDCLLFYLGYQRQGSGVSRTNPAGTASHWNAFSSTGFSGHWLGGASVVQAAAGLSDARDWAVGASGFGGVTIALAPSASASTLLPKLMQM